MKKTNWAVLLFLCCGFFNICCIHHPKVEEHKNIDSISTTAGSSSKYPFLYDLDHPSQKLKLPDALTEISGMDVYKDAELVCNQDEKGNVYLYDVNKGELDKRIPFAKDGDYEGIANVNDTIYVLKSDGKLYQLINFNKQDQKTVVIKTFLQKENNTEGLCFDKKNYRLLIACKSDPGAGLKNVRAIYSFDLKTKQLLQKPVFTISLDSIKRYIAKVSPAEFTAEELRDIIDAKKGDVAFQPSDLAIHPISGDIYVIATVGKLMVILHPDGTIAFIKQFSATEFKQPEGITFLNDGTMFISDEGRNGLGNILKFNYQSK
ncbi:MAG: hypothetical protein H0W62_04600 [Chitinophagales bacterium]|nr:hypothetical protein [Chitinophagales bacterium]